MKKMFKIIYIYMCIYILIPCICVFIEALRVLSKMNNSIVRKESINYLYYIFYTVIFFIIYLFRYYAKREKKLSDLLKLIENLKNNGCESFLSLFVIFEMIYAYRLGEISYKIGINTLNPMAGYGNKFSSLEMLYWVSIYMIISFIVLLGIYFKTKINSIITFGISFFYFRIFICILVLRYTNFRS